MRQKVPIFRKDQDQTSTIRGDGTVILYGAGPFTPPTIHALGQRGISVACICDDSVDKHEVRLMGVPVISTDKAQAAFPKATIIITAASRHIEELRSQLVGMGWIEIRDCAHLLASFEYDRDSFTSGLGWLHFNLDRYFYEYFLTYCPDQLIIPSIDIMITEKCSLRCRDCANLMQYYTNPQDMDFDKLFASLDILMQCVDHVLEFRVLGGETFMNRRAHQYVERLRQYSNYTRISVYSNGTIVPSDEQLRCLACEDTYLRISDYGPLSRKIKAMTEALDAHGVTYEVEAMEGWQDCAVIANRERTPEELETIYSCCCASKILTLLNAHLYPCPFAANASNLGALPPFPQDSIEIECRLSKWEIRDRLFGMLRTNKFISACRYCAGRRNGVLPLPVAIQASSPLPYKRRPNGDV